MFGENIAAIANARSRDGASFGKAQRPALDGEPFVEKLPNAFTCDVEQVADVLQRGAHRSQEQDGIFAFEPHRTDHAAVAQRPI